MNAIQTDRAPAAIGPYSQAIISGKMVYTSGQIPCDPFHGTGCRRYHRFSGRTGDEKSFGFA